MFSDPYAMNTRLLAVSATLLGSLFLPVISAETVAPAPQAPLAPSAAPTTEDAVKSDLDALIARVRAKLKDGQQSEAALATELGAFDALLAKYAAEKTDAVARVAMMKAMLYLEVIENTDAGIAELEKLARDFPATKIAARVPEMIVDIRKKAAAEAATAVGQPFAPFKETATDGTVIDLAAYKGKIVLVDFWATWCGPCVQELPNVLSAYEKYHAQGFEVIGVSLDKDGAALAAFTKEHKMAWPQIFDGLGWKNKLAQAYGIQSIPATFLLDGEGKIIAKGLRGEALANKVGEALAARKTP